ncbi:MAG: hypothetical protein M1840_005460 [Geoglossum simile]|nr:MAG: hypothetical protein M1840_005460 [Geoglossum simile]
MAQHWPSIQSFFQPDGTKTRKADVLACGDGFTTEEVDAVLHPTGRSWNPRQEYTERNIGDLVPGLGRTTFTGRVVNLFEIQTHSKMPRAAKGFTRVILKDDTGALVGKETERRTQVKLWFANAAYQLCLGQLCTVHATYIANADITNPATAAAPLMVSIFPERDSSCHFMIKYGANDTGVLCKTPLGHHEGQPLAGLMTLQNFIEGGYEVAMPRILVCVKSIGARKKFINKNNQSNEKVDVGIFDDTAEASLVLWGSIGVSVAPWQASQTVLLLTSPSIKLGRRAQLSITSTTHVDVDPKINDAVWLRKIAQRLTRRECVNPRVEEGVFDLETVVGSEIRTLFTLADLDEFARAAPGEKFTGFLSVIILELNLVSLYRRSRLFCTECCGIPIYTNTPQTTTCPNCTPSSPTLSFSLNPKIVGPLIDETGTLAPGKTVWTGNAWRELFGGQVSEEMEGQGELDKECEERLKKLEQRIVFGRVTLVFGWQEEVAGGRVVVLGVRA